MSAVEKLVTHEYQTAKISSSVVRDFCIQLLEMGIPPQAIIKIYDFRHRPSNNHDARVCIDTYKELVTLGSVFFPEKEIGLIYRERFELSEQGPLGQLFSSSYDLRRALKNIVKHGRILADHMFFEFDEQNDFFSISYQHASYFSNRHDIVRTFSTLLNWIKIFTNQDLSPIKMSFQFDNINPKRPLEKAFGTKILFGQLTNTMYFKVDALNIKNPHFEEYQHERLSNQVHLLDSRINSEDGFVERVRRIIEKNAISESLSADTIAHMLNMSKRTFFRRLQHLGTSYQALLDDVKKEMATNYIVSESYQLKRLPYLLGYSDARCFDRAFRRWMGCTARQFSNQFKHLSAV